MGPQNFERHLTLANQYILYAHTSFPTLWPCIHVPRQTVEYPPFASGQLPRREIWPVKSGASARVRPVEGSPGGSLCWRPAVGV